MYVDATAPPLMFVLRPLHRTRSSKPRSALPSRRWEHQNERRAFPPPTTFPLFPLPSPLWNVCHSPTDIKPPFVTQKHFCARAQGVLQGWFTFVKDLWNSQYGSLVTNPTSNHEVAGSVPALTQWVDDPALP